MEDKSSAGTLALKHVFGSTANSFCVEIADRNTLLYVAGHNIIKHKIKENSQEFIYGQQNYFKISCLSLCTGGTTLAVAELGDKPIIYLYETVTMRKKKFLFSNDLLFMNADYKAVKYKRNDNNFLFAILESDQKTTLCVWNTSTSLIVESLELGESEIFSSWDFSFNNSSNFVVVGNNFANVYKFDNHKITHSVNLLDSIESQVVSRQFVSAQVCKATDDIFIRNRENMIFVFTFDGKLKWFFKSIDDLAFIIPMSDGYLSMTERFSLCRHTIASKIQEANPRRSLSKNIFDVEADVMNDLQNENLQTTKLNVFQKLFNDNNLAKDENNTEESDLEIEGLTGNVLNEVLTLKPPKDFKEGELDAFIYNPEIEKAMVITTGRQIYTLNFESQEKISWSVIVDNSHTSRITSMDIALKKPFIVTSGMDKTVKVWNYETNKIETEWSMTEEPQIVGIHPSGLFVVIGFSDRLIVMTIYPDAIGNKRKVIREIQVKNLKEFKFTNGGDKLAVASGIPQIITLYKFLTMEAFAHLTFKGHTGKISGIHFSEDDTIMYTCASDGMVYQWNLIEGQRLEVVTKGSPIAQMAVKRDPMTFYLATADDKSIIEFNEKHKKKINTGINFSQIIISKNYRSIFTGGAAANADMMLGIADDTSKMLNTATPTRNLNPLKSTVVGNAKNNDLSALATGTNNCQLGVIRYYKNLANFETYDSIQAHSVKGISRLMLTPNEKFLISSGNDGVICIFDIKENDLRLTGDVFTFSEEILASRSEIEEVRIKKEALISALQDNQVQNSHSISINDTEDKIKLMEEELALKQKNEDFIVEEALKRKIARIEEIETQKNRVLVANEEEISDLEHFYNKAVAAKSKKTEKWKSRIKLKEAEHLESQKAFIAIVEHAYEQLMYELQGKVNEKKKELEYTLQVS